MLARSGNDARAHGEVNVVGRSTRSLAGICRKRKGDAIMYTNTVRIHRVLRATGIAVFLLFCREAPAQAYSVEIPRHLAIARELVERIKPEDNRYALGKEFISVPGDGPDAKYAMTADCSGFLLAIFERAGYRTRQEMAFLKTSPKRKRPAAEDFVFSIEQEKGFRHIRKVGDMKPGDLLAHAMLNIQDQKRTGTTGHVFLVNSEPRPVSGRMPLVSGTQQFEISVIDANEEHVGTDDTRLANPWKRVTGLGKGTIRIYVDDNGEVIGWARTFGNTDRFFSYSSRFPSDTKQRKSAIGRPKGAEASRG